MKQPLHTVTNLTLAATLVLLLAGCGRDSVIDVAPHVSKRAFPSGTVQGQTERAFAEDLLQEINRIRIRNGATPLRSDPRLDRIAEQHSQSMARHAALSHSGFEERFHRADSQHCVENVAWNYPSPTKTVESWLKSDAHRVNLLDTEINTAGVAIINGYATFFGCRR
ncbi:MAG: CAP domain-containing protein [Desulfovibrionaceae bacterium]